MQNRWRDEDAARFRGPLGPRVYSSRLLGADPALVLHGGGNTSVKLYARTVLGERERILYVKGSGWDLAGIEAEGFAPVRLDRLLRLAQLERLSDAEMVNELRTHMLDASAPTPSVEAILHAVIPHAYVDHTHADAVITITNTPGGRRRIEEIYGDRVVVIPYVMPGFDLARVVAQRFPREATDRTIGMILMNHGVFSFGASARESYTRMIALVNQAERYLKRKRAWSLPAPRVRRTGTEPLEAIADLRQDVSAAAGGPMILQADSSARALAFARHPRVRALSQRGPATPDHVIRTKRVPLLGRDVARYAEQYRRYFERHAPRAREPKTMLDPAPRVILDRTLGLLTAGRSARDAAIVRDLYRHTVEIILRADRLGGYRALPQAAIFEVEYWDLEQAKLRKGGAPPPLQGEIALVTGAASGIGRACVESLLARGAAVAGLDVDRRIETLWSRPDVLGVRCDVTSAAQVRAAMERTVHRFGGLDLLILNAGVFPKTERIASLGDDTWRRVMAVNLDANLRLMRAAHPLLCRAPRGGRVVVIGSKNVPAPGPGAAAYSASKAALTQLMRVAALEWAADRIRVNCLHPNAVFDTGIWTEEVLRSRARAYGLSVAEYKRRNLLQVEVESRDVAELAAEMCGPLFAKTTGAQVPVDGGDERVI